jgi:hypothetical protein
MKKILIQYLYIFGIASVILFFFTWASACELEQVDETLPLCEEYQVSTEENPCRKDSVDINTLSDALNKLGESGTIPK